MVTKNVFFNYYDLQISSINNFLLEKHPLYLIIVNKSRNVH